MDQNISAKIPTLTIVPLNFFACTIVNDCHYMHNISIGLH